MITRYSQLLSPNLAPLLKEAKQFSSPEEWLRKGGMSIEALDKAAFGFTEDEITELQPQQLKVKYKADLENVLWQIKQSGLSKKQWAETVSLETPIEVSYAKGKFYIEDGHHRYYAAKILGLPLKVNLSITEKPLPLLTTLSYDDFHLYIWNAAQEKI